MAEERIKQNDVPQEIQKLFDERHRMRISSSFRTARPLIIRRAMITGAILMILLYILMPVSRVRNISLHGNDRLSSSYIMDTADVSRESVFFLTIPPLVEHRLENDPLIS